MRHQAFLDTTSFGRHRALSPGLDLALVSWLLFGLAFLCPPAALLGAALAHAGRNRGGALARSHADRQIRLFWHSLLVLLLVGLLHAVVAGLAAITFGVGAVFMVVPWALGLGWLGWAAWTVGTGALRCWRRQPA